MSLVKPFKALHYNHELIKDFSKVVCPPYDVIDKREEQRFKKTSSYNFCNILTTDSKNTYQHLQARFRDWLGKGVIVEDDKPCFYLYEQKFRLKSELHRRVGFLCLLRIDKGGIVFPHEHTFALPKKDRYYILKELKANLSPIFLIVPDKLNVLRSTYKLHKSRKPFIGFKDFSNIDNKVWRIEDSTLIKKIVKSFKSKRLFIADGHHRFEVAYQYFRRTKRNIKDLNYTLAYITDTTSGVLIFPTHRVVKTSTSLKEVFRRLSSCFDITKLDKDSFTKYFCDGLIKEMMFGLYVKRNYYLLRLRSKNVLDRIFNKGKNIIYKELDVYVLHKLLLSSLNNTDIVYTHSLEEAVRLAKGDRLSFILKPTPLEVVFKIAARGYRLPHKSTYFYPKLLSGIVARRFEL